jgi:hypothetical protein
MGDRSGLSRRCRLAYRRGDETAGRVGDGGRVGMYACAVCALSSGDVKLSKQYHRSPGVMCPDTGQPCTKGCDATAKPCDRNGSVHPNSVPPIDENAQIERLARLLHDAGRSAVEPSGLSSSGTMRRNEPEPDGEVKRNICLLRVWCCRAIRRWIASPPTWLNCDGWPSLQPLTIPKPVTVNASNPADAEAKRFIFQTPADGLRKPVTVNGNAVCPLWRQLGNLCPCSRDSSLDHAAYCETGPGKNSPGMVGRRGGAVGCRRR